MATTNFVAGTLIESTWLNDVDAHVYDQATGAHTAANIAVVDTAGNFTSTDVEGALVELAAGSSISGSFTGVTITAGTNVSAVQTAGFYIVRAGNIVSFSGYFEGINVTAANTLSTIYVTLPVASAFSFADAATGTVVGLNSALYLATGTIVADSTNDRLLVNFLPTGTGVIQLQATGSYLVQ
jgi:hypothetical protein